MIDGAENNNEITTTESSTTSSIGDTLDDELPKIDWSKVPCPSQSSRKKRQLGQNSDEKNKAGDAQKNRKGDKGSNEKGQGKGWIAPDAQKDNNQPTQDRAPACPRTRLRPHHMARTTPRNVDDAVL